MKNETIYELKPFKGMQKEKITETLNELSEGDWITVWNTVAYMMEEKFGYAGETDRNPHPFIYENNEFCVDMTFEYPSDLLKALRDCTYSAWHDWFIYWNKVLYSFNNMQDMMEYLELPDKYLTDKVYEYANLDENGIGK